MRSSVLLASALAVGAIAGPLHKRLMVTETDLEIVTVTVYVTPGQADPTAGGQARTREHGHGHGHHHPKPKPSAPAAFSSAPAPAPSSAAPKPSSVYTPPPPPPSSTPTPTPEPASSPAPSSSAAAPSSQAPTSSTPTGNGEHTSGTIQATFSSGIAYQESVLWHHNRARANHGATPLVWNTTCEDAARTAAAVCDFQHHVVNGQGQNLFTVSGDMFNVTGGITDSWYKGEADVYTAWGANPDDSTFHQWGHMTQVVWKGTTSVGCVSIDCGSAMTINGRASELNKYTVCNYSPPGNYGGQYAQNVAAPIGDYHKFLWSD